jgi:hypothetical protein
VTSQESNRAQEDFRAEMNDLYASCGSPPYKELTKISERLDELYPLPEGGKRDPGFPALSKSALSETLNGRRKGLPAASWLSSFVLACQRRAWEVGVREDDPGLTSLPEWHRKLSAAQAAAEPSAGEDATDKTAGRGRRRRRRSPRSSAASPDGGSGGSAERRAEIPRPSDPVDDRGTPPAAPPDSSGGGGIGPGGPVALHAVTVGSGATLGAASGTVAVLAPATHVHPVRVPVGASAVRTAVRLSAVPVHLPAPLRDYVAGYGPYGQLLLTAAQDRAIDAVHQVAVLLLAADSVSGGAEAQRLLIYAAAAEHRDAINLLDAHPTGLDRLDAAGHACELADVAEADGHRPAAKVFYECAARNGLPAASAKLAEILLAEGRRQQAIRWLVAAAHQGDSGAEIRLEALRRIGRVRPSRPAPTPSGTPRPGYRPTIHLAGAPAGDRIITTRQSAD